MIRYPAHSLNHIRIFRPDQGSDIYFIHLFIYIYDQRQIFQASYCKSVTEAQEANKKNSPVKLVRCIKFRTYRSITDQ